MVKPGFRNLDDDLQERRAKPRIACSYPVLVRSHGSRGAKFEEEAILSNMSATGMYLHLNQHIRSGDTVFLVIRFSNDPPSQFKAPRIAATGEVVRIEPKTDGAFGVAVKLQQHRFL